MSKPLESIWKIAFVGGGNIINALIGFLFFTAVAKTLTLEDFGKYALLTSILVGLAKTTDLGTNSVYVARSVLLNNFHTVEKFHISKIVLFLVSLPISTLCLIFFKMWTISNTLIMFTGLFAYALNYTLYAHFQRLQKFGQLVILNTFPALLKGTFATLVFLKIFSPSITQAFGIFSFSMLASFVLYFSLPKSLKFSIKLERGVVSFIKEAFPGGVSQLVAEVWPALNNGIAKLARNFSDVGVFSMSGKFAQIFANISLSIFAVLLPKNATRKREDLGYNYAETFFISVGLLGAALIGIFGSEMAIKLIFGPKFEGSLGILSILIFSYAITAIHTFMENYFYIENKVKTLAGISLGKTLVFCILAINLIRIHSLTGLAWANFISSICTLVATIILIRRVNGDGIL